MRGIPLEDSERPLCAVGQDIGETDTFIQRLANTSGLNGGVPVPVPIEIVALHLQSVQPFTVNNNGHLEEWTLDVTIQGSQPIGNMQIRKANPNGGSFNSFLPVQLLLSFTRVNPCPAVSQCTVVGPVIQFNSTSVPWSYAPAADVLQLPGCTTNFFPGVTPSFAEGVQDLAPLEVQFTEQSLLVKHGVIPPPPPKLHQLDWQTAVHFNFTLQNNGNQPIDDFHILNAKFIPMLPPAALGDSTIYIKSVSICDPTPFWPPTPPVSWCRVDWDSLSPTYRRVAHWHFPLVPPGAKAPAMDIVFSVPCAVPPGTGAWYEVTYVCTYNCVPVDSSTFRFHCSPEPPCTNPLGCRNTPITGAVGPSGPGSKIELLQQNVPNPFNPRTTIQFRMEREGSVALRVYDAQGRLVRKLLDERRAAGDHAVVWDGRDEKGLAISAGAYFYQVEIAGVRQTKRMVVVR